FFQKKPVEELYDTQADPWEIKNLAGDPTHEGTLQRLRALLRDWQLGIQDLGFLPEADLRTRFGTIAPHQAVRADPKVYPLERLMGVVDLAQKGERLGDLLVDPDPAVRFWGA